MTSSGRGGGSGRGWGCRSRGVSAGEQARVTWSYDPTGQLLAEARSGANAYRTTYVYDPSGNRTVEITETNRTTSVYDGASRLLASNSFSGNTTATGSFCLRQEIHRLFRR
ncbi:hypothetical protein [Planctellipticum variicoloris]|uniref:hypothetical protein n=1 Tax=Planctellipticum variicoloris TaxID=3064265 RepID=UPI0030134E81|nr:hypothetical protein SH412_002479 [Planctomycetaceae bacterium SH412]